MLDILFAFFLLKDLVFDSLLDHVFCILAGVRVIDDKVWQVCKANINTKTEVNS